MQINTPKPILVYSPRLVWRCSHRQPRRCRQLHTATDMRTCILPYIYIITEVVATYLRNYLGSCISAGRATEKQPYPKIPLETNDIIQVI